jgi:aromatic-L-amino-acid decarboxylase
LTARERHTNWRSNETGLAGGEVFTAYCSAEAHSSVEKAARIAGLGAANLRKIAVDERFAMRADALEAAIHADLEAGRTPLFAVATLGTTGSSGFDPLQRIGEVCAGQGIWLHVDAAWAGSALVLPEHRWMIEGVEHAESFVFNPHKWLFTNFDCSAYFVRDAAALVRTFEILPEYLKTPEAGRVTDYRDWGIPLGRRFRALKLWFVLRSYGVEGLRAAIQAHIDMAHALARQIDAAPDFELLVPPVLSLLCFRYRPAGAADAALKTLNQRLLNALHDSGALYLTQTRINGDLAIRFAIGQTATETRHVEAAWARIQETARAEA